MTEAVDRAVVQQRLQRNLHMPLASGQHGDDRLAATLGPQLQLGREPALAAPQRFNVCPIPDSLVPARASRVLMGSPKREAFAAGMTVASTKCRSQSTSPQASASACSASRTRSQTPLPASGRTGSIPFLPDHSAAAGRARAFLSGAPMICRSKYSDGPQWAALSKASQGGSNGCKRRHCVSINSLRLTPSIWDYIPEMSVVCRHALDGFRPA